LQNLLGVTSKIFDSVDMVFPFRKMRRMIDAMVLEVACIKDIVRAVAVGVNNAVRLDFFAIKGIKVLDRVFSTTTV